jgi:predicted lipoprotein with Yx(FWY)xxD motif
MSVTLISSQRRARLSLVLAAVALGVAACGGGGAPSATGSQAATAGSSGAAAGGYGAPAQTMAPSGAAAGAATMSVAHTTLGDVLVGPDGHTVYLFEKDTGSSSTCADACASAWPPVETKAQPHAGAGVQAALLGTTHRPDGKTEVTYAGHPLYYFSGDSKPGDVKGQGLKGFGAPWYVVAPSGQKIDND